MIKTPGSYIMKQAGYYYDEETGYDYRQSRIWKTVSKSASKLVSFGNKLIAVGKQLFGKGGICIETNRTNWLFYNSFPVLSYIFLFLQKTNV